MKLSHLRDVLAVADHGSIRAAGRRLGATQPAITRSIREIEQELGVSLFERHAKGVRLTDMGRIFARRAESMQSEVRRAREEIDQLKGSTVGEISVAMSTATILSLMPQATTAFRERYPDAVIKIHESFLKPIEKDLLSGRVDLYVGPLCPETNAPQLMTERLFDNQRLILGRKGHPLAGARSMDELAGVRWVRPMHIVEGRFEEMFTRTGLPPPNVVLNTRSALVTVLALVNSDLLTAVPRQWLDLPILAGVLEPLALPPLSAAPVAIVRRRDMPLTPIAKHFCDTMRQVGVHYAQECGV